ncbi:MAG: hypothetical protein FWG69_01495 [Oscillospiraceae bacterium]|nr:hypothetical protein [Oscillospiraceae bacterium]
MKKITLLVCIVMIGLFASTGCIAQNTQASVYKIYNEFAQSMNDAKTSDTELDLKINMDEGENNLEIATTGNIKIDIRNEQNIKMLMDMNFKTINMDMSMKMYFEDGYAYVDYSGQKFKSEMPLDAAMQQIKANTEVIMFPETAVKDFETSKIDGITKHSFTLEANAIRDALKSTLDNIQMQVGQTLDDSNVEMGDMICEIEMGKNGKVSNYRSVFKLSVQAEEQNIKMDNDIKIKINSIGGDIIIDPPADLDQYQQQGTM